MIRTCLIVLAAFSATACGFQPAYAPSAYSAGSISIPSIEGRTGHYLRQELVRSLGHGVPGLSSGRLEIAVSEGIENLNFQPDQAASRSDYIASSAWTLYNADGDAVASGGSREAASFNFANAAFADISAQSAAQERVAILLARSIRQDILQQIGQNSPTSPASSGQ